MNKHENDDVESLYAAERRDCLNGLIIGTAITLVILFAALVVEYYYC